MTATTRHRSVLRDTRLEKYLPGPAIALVEELSSFSWPVTVAFCSADGIDGNPEAIYTEIWRLICSNCNIDVICFIDVMVQKRTAADSISFTDDSAARYTPCIWNCKSDGQYLTCWRPSRLTMLHY